MAEISEQFIQECLDQHRLEVNMAEVILEIAQGRDATEALLERVDRSDILSWLGNEMEAIVEAMEPKPVDEVSRKNAAILLRYLDSTKAEGSAGLQVEVDPETPEELDEIKYYQVFNVTIRYEEAELVLMAPESEGQFKEGTWVAEPVKWAPLLQGLVPLPELVSGEPEIEVEEEEDSAKREQDVMREIERGTLGGTLERSEEGPAAQMYRAAEPPQTPDLFR